ncbi:MAG TPA: hypothetical protein VGN63_04305 [Flavisolibacter sp.]|nr:hypothetical protein [Flavisolibacter sp.]
MFNFFKKATRYPIPEKYTSLIGQEDYNLLIKLAKEHFAEEKAQIVSIRDGEIILESGEEEKHCYLDNLVRKLSACDKQEWKAILAAHFERLKDHSEAYTYFFKDFDYASGLLRAFIKPPEAFPDTAANYVSRVDFPGTVTVLAIEYENQFRFCLRDESKQWEVPEEELFRIAIANNPKDEVNTEAWLFLDKFPGYMFFSGDYAAGMLLDMENNAAEAIGTYGSLVAIPSKELAIAAPIEDGNVLDLLQAVHPAVYKSYNEAQGNITTGFYWYYEGTFVPFPVREEGRHSVISLPEDLKNLF